MSVLFVQGKINGPKATNCLLLALFGNVSPFETDIGLHHKSTIEPCLPLLLDVVEAMPIGKNDQALSIEFVSVPIFVNSGNIEPPTDSEVHKAVKLPEYLPKELMPKDKLEYVIAIPPVLH